MKENKTKNGAKTASSQKEHNAPNFNASVNLPHTEIYEKGQEKIKDTTRNFKINTRIVLTAVLAIVIPLIIIGAFSSFFINWMASNYNFSSVTTSSYSLINQIQWSQALVDISNALTANTTEENRQSSLEGLTASVEDLGYSFYIEKNGEEYYCSEDTAAKDADVDRDENQYSFNNNDFTIVNIIEDGDDSYTIIVKNNSYNASSVLANATTDNYENLVTSRTIVIILAIIIVFIVAIVVISLITTKTIVKPINKISAGANEIANGNLDYEIDYKSKNELGVLTKNFNHMRHKLKRAEEKQAELDRQQKEMIAGIAHDLRTPLTSIKAYVEGLRDGIANTPEKQKEYLNTIYSSTCDMEKMLNDLLTVSKMELGNFNLNLEEVSLEDFLGFVGYIEEDLKRQDFDFEIVNNAKSNPVFMVDTDNFERVIRNIFSNSVKYKKPDVKGKITLIISEYSQYVIFEIKDNGMGVDKESLPKIFDTLYRADKARTNVSDGSGLGLSVCKQIIEKHGGLIWAQSELGEGLSIFISMPIYKKDENGQ